MWGAGVALFNPKAELAFSGRVYNGRPLGDNRRRGPGARAQVGCESTVEKGGSPREGGAVGSSHAVGLLRTRGSSVR